MKNLPLSKVGKNTHTHTACKHHSCIKSRCREPWLVHCFLKKENPSLIYIHIKLPLEIRPHGDEQTKVRSTCSLVSSGDMPAGSLPTLPAKDCCPARARKRRDPAAPGWPGWSERNVCTAVTASSTPGARCSAGRARGPFAGGPQPPGDARRPATRRQRLLTARPWLVSGGTGGGGGGHPHLREQSSCWNLWEGHQVPQVPVLPRAVTPKEQGHWGMLFIKWLKGCLETQRGPLNLLLPLKPQNSGVPPWWSSG